MSGLSALRTLTASHILALSLSLCGALCGQHCRKKFCAQCMGKYETIERVDELFRLQEDGGLTEWQCPACADTCECAACWRKRHPNSGANIPKPNGQPGTPQQTSPPQQQQQQQHTPQTPGQLSQQHTPQQSLPTTPQFNNGSVHGMNAGVGPAAGGGGAGSMSSVPMHGMGSSMNGGMGAMNSMGMGGMNGMGTMNGVNGMGSLNALNNVNGAMNGMSNGMSGGINSGMNGGIGNGMSNGMMDGMNGMSGPSMSAGSFNLGTMPSTV